MTNSHAAHSLLNSTNNCNRKLVVLFWLIRLSVPVLIAGVIFAWYSWSQNEAESLDQLTKKNALMTAKVWIASARYRSDSTAYTEYRDSLLVEEATSIDEMDQFLKMYEGEPENYLRFSSLVSKYIDSLSKIEDIKEWTDSTVVESVNYWEIDTVITAQPRMR